MLIVFGITPHNQIIRAYFCYVYKEFLAHPSVNTLHKLKSPSHYVKTSYGPQSTVDNY